MRQRNFQSNQLLSVHPQGSLGGTCTSKGTCTHPHIHSTQKQLNTYTWTVHMLYLANHYAEIAYSAMQRTMYIYACHIEWIYSKYTTII